MAYLIPRIFAAILIGFTAPAYAEGLFASFAGAWRGKGSIVMADGSQEAIRCKANYAVNAFGDAMNIDVNCASDSYSINIIARIIARGVAVSGQWQETSRGVQGSVSGQTLVPGQLEANLEGLGFGIRLSASTKGRIQEVAARSEGTDVQSVFITFRR